MPRNKREAVEFKRRAVDSLVLAIEIFNRPYEHGRSEAVLILLHHAFEMLLKGVIQDQTGTVHEKSGKYTYSFAKCLEMARNQIGLISSDEKISLSILDAHRDTAMHHYQVISEELLYVQAQAAATLFDALLRKGFGDRLADSVPERVLPVSTRPPSNLKLLVGNELSKIDQLLDGGQRKGAIATARLRPLMAMSSASRDDVDRVSEQDVRKAVRRRRKGDDWTIILPDVAQLRLDTAGDGPTIHLSIKKDADVAVRVAKPGEPVEGTVVRHEINIWDKYNLGRDDIAKKVGISGPKTSAVMIELGIPDDDECFKLLTRKKSEIKGYSKKALDRVRQALKDGLDVDEVWKKHRHRFGARRKKHS